MSNQIVLYGLLTVMHFSTAEECQMWSDKIYGDGFKCFKSYKYKEWHVELPLNRPKDLDEKKLESE